MHPSAFLERHWCELLLSASLLFLTGIIAAPLWQ